jgi:hypothetical protein
MTRKAEATMTKRLSLLSVFGIALLAFGACGPAEPGGGDDAMAGAESTAGAAPTRQAVGNTPTPDELTVSEVLPLSCAQVWAIYGEREGLVVEIVKAMAGTSVETRGLTFPQTEEAGAALGTRILEGCEADRDELLYAIVDRGVREVVAEMGPDE